MTNNLDLRNRRSISFSVSFLAPELILCARVLQTNRIQLLNDFMVSQRCRRASRRDQKAPSFCTQRIDMRTIIGQFSSYFVKSVNYAFIY